jgi:hypothetical protein
VIKSDSRFAYKLRNARAAVRKHDSHGFVIAPVGTRRERLENFLEVAKFFATLRMLELTYRNNPQAFRRKSMERSLRLLTSMKDLNLQTSFEVL